MRYALATKQEKHNHMVSIAVREVSVAKSNRLWKNSLPTARQPLRSQRVTMCLNVVEGWSERNRAATLNKDQRL